MANSKKQTGRKPKTSAKTEEVKTELTKEEVYNVMEFAASLYNNGGLYNMWAGVANPELINSRLKDITLNPLTATDDKVNRALQDPKNNEQELIGFSEYFEMVSMLYKRLLLYLSGLMSFELSYVCINATEKDYKDNSTYLKQLNIVEDFFNKFDIKKEFPIALKQMLRNEAFFGVLRTDSLEKYIIQELPYKYSKITGRWDYGLAYDFNMQWFLQPSVSLDLYPKVFTDFFKKTFIKPENTLYNPANWVNERVDSWVYWVQTKPEDGFVCFKLNPELGTLIPFFSPLMPDVVMQPIIRQLQKNSYIIEATKILFGQVGFLRDAKSSVKDALTVTPDTLGKFLGLIKSALPDVIKLASAPLENTQALQFDGNNELYDSYLKSTSSLSGINSRLLYSYDRQNVSETRLSMDIDVNILRPVYKQFEDILDYWVNSRTKKFKFHFTLNGFNTYLDRQERLDNATKMGAQGIVIDQLYANALGINPFHFRKMLAETRMNGFVDKLTPIVASAQLSAGTQAGRPQKSDSEIGDSGAQSKGDGSAEEKNQF